MDIWYLFKGIIIGFAVSIPLGPIGVLCVQRTVNKSWRSGFYSGLGAAFSDSLYAVISGFSLTYIINFIRQFQMEFQLVGGFVLLALGIHIFRTNPVTEIRKYRRKGSSYFQDMLSTFIVTFSNPLAIFVFLAVFAGSGIVMKISEPLDASIIIFGIFVGAASWWLLLTSLVNMFRHKMNLRVLWWFNKIAGAGVIAFVMITLLLLLINKPNLIG
ncbi:LysE family translocator [Puteibacter caeruleilacunae]|nr:LysE family translocator [Puteibacter caeruleilacunae]